MAQPADRITAQPAGGITAQPAGGITARKIRAGLGVPHLKRAAERC
jgi:hypothetical protein